MFQRNKALQIAIGIIAAFALCYVVVPHNLLKNWLDAGRVGMWATVFGVTVPIAIVSFFARRRKQGQVVAIALNLLAFVILIQATWIPIRRAYGHFVHDWVSDLMGMVIALAFIVSGAFFLMPIGNTTGVTPPRNWWFLLTAGIAGALFMGIMIGLGLQNVSA